MSEEVKKSIKEGIGKLYESLMEKPLRVLGIFNDFFGEDMVDMQDYPELHRFGIWMSIVSISTYCDRQTVGMSSKEWNLHKDSSITELPASLVNNVLSVFENPNVKDTIGRLKFNNIFILVHFPHVRITNENDRYVDINHLWAKVKVLYNGTLNGGFTLNRSEYTMLHFMSNFMHSHISSIPKDDFTRFQSPCTGSGPINTTIATLNRDYDEDMWNMFCLELSKYVTVESIIGRPYYYLEKIGTNSMEVSISRFIPYLNMRYYDDVVSTVKIREFVKKFVNAKKLKFNYVNGCYSIGMTLPEYMILVSNEFISWYNDQFNKNKIASTFDRLKNRGLVEECIIDNGKIYYGDDRISVNNISEYIGKKVCIFKGREVTLDITDIAEVRNENKSIILNTRFALYILNIILKVLNYRYGRETAIHEDTQLGTEVRYL